MPLKRTLLIIFSLIALNGCGSMPDLPDPPTVEMCFPNYPKDQDPYCACGMANPAQFLEKTVTVRGVKHYPIEKCDKNAGFPPESWKIMQDYLNELRKYAGDHCK